MKTDHQHPLSDEDQARLAVWMTGVVLTLTAIIHATGREDERDCLARLCDLTSEIMERWDKEEP